MPETYDDDVDTIGWTTAEHHQQLADIRKHRKTTLPPTWLNTTAASGAAAAVIIWAILVGQASIHPGDSVARGDLTILIVGAVFTVAGFALAAAWIVVRHINIKHKEMDKLRADERRRDQERLTQMEERINQRIWEAVANQWDQPASNSNGHVLDLEQRRTSRRP